MMDEKVRLGKLEPEDYREMLLWNTRVVLDEGVKTRMDKLRKRLEEGND